MRPAPPISHFTPGLRRLMSWWNTLPFGNEAERLNGAMLQAVLALSLLVQAGSLALALTSAIGIDHLAVGLAIINIAVLSACLALLRRGHMAWSARIFIVASLSLLTIAYLQWGLAVQATQQLLQLVPVLIGGALLSRRAMWATVAWLVFLVAIGGWRDAMMHAYHTYQLQMIGNRVFSSILGFSLTAFVLDRSLSSLRENLKISRQRGSDLARARDLLQVEMEEKERQRDQLIHAQKMESVGRLAGGVAHDFNHLLTLVLGHAARGRSSDTLEDAHEAFLDVQSAARRAVAVSRRLLDFSRMETTRIEIFDPAEAISEMGPLLRQIFPAQTSLNIDLPPSSSLICFDRAQLELVLLTLAANANHAMPNGGSFSISLDYTQAEMVEIIASDTGCGMDDNVRQRCTEPFFTTKPVGQGTGLGLSVAANLIHAADGSISIDSTLGEGTIVRIALPLQRG